MDCEILTDSGQTVEGSSEHSDTEQYSVNYSQTVDGM
jgi:hypothetical protein